MAVPKRDFKDVKISDLKKAMNDPNFLKAVRQFDPELAKLSDEDFKKVAASVDSRLDQFKDKFRDMTLEEGLDLGAQQKAQKSEPPKMVSDIKTKELIASLKRLENQDKLTFSDHLNGGDSVVVADIVELRKNFSLFGKELKILSSTKPEEISGIKYVFRVNGNKLYVYSMKDTTEDELVLTLAYVVPMKPDVFGMLYDQYISKKDRYYTCSEDLLDRAHYRVSIDNTFKDMDDSVMTLIEHSFKENPNSFLVFETVPEQK